MEVAVADVVVAVEELMAVLLNLYTSNLPGPPQYSDVLPLQSMLHPVKPSAAGPPPLENTLPQSIKYD